MKKKIGEIQGKPLVIGDANIVTPNEIHVEEIKKNKDIGEPVVIETKDVVDIYCKKIGDGVFQKMYIVVKSPYTFMTDPIECRDDTVKQIKTPSSNILASNLNFIFALLELKRILLVQEINIKITGDIEGEILAHETTITGFHPYMDASIVILDEKFMQPIISYNSDLIKVELPDNLNDLLFLRLTVPPILLEYK